VHCALVITAQWPFGMQHAPVAGVGHRPVVQVVLSPWYEPFRVWQRCAVSTRQCPFARQHAPRGGSGQVVALHSVPSPWYVPPKFVHWACDVTKQPLAMVPGVLGRQHAPSVGVGHVVRPQIVPLPWYVPPCELHSACVVIVHMPAGVQHAPVGAGVHVTLVQSELSPLYVPPSCAHCCEVVVTQLPVGRQHAPVGFVPPPGGMNTPCAFVVLTSERTRENASASRHSAARTRTVEDMKNSEAMGL
jgi:hypothetical protein